MAGNAYPHIVFAKNAEILPQQALADILVGLFPDATVEQGEIKATLQLADDYTATFWYDDDADGLGERYADFAAPLRRKRVTRCTTMIDASGDADPSGIHARDLARIMAALAERDGVYVFSEETKRFVGMDYDDEPGAVAPTLPEADLRSDVSAPAHVEDGARDVVLDSESRDFPHTEHHPVDRPAEEPAVVREPVVEERVVVVDEPHREPAPAEPTPVRHDEPTTVEEPVVARPAEPTPVQVEEPMPADHPAPEEPTVHRPAAETTPEALEPVETPAAAHHPVEPARPEEARPADETGKPGLFKRLFGRKR